MEKSHRGRQNIIESQKDVKTGQKDSGHREKETGQLAFTLT
jgi:hypothetical protein